jgi:hypothetical protein
MQRLQMPMMLCAALAVACLQASVADISMLDASASRLDLPMLEAYAPMLDQIDDDSTDSDSFCADTAHFQELDEAELSKLDLTMLMNTDSNMEKMVKQTEAKNQAAYDALKANYTKEKDAKEEARRNFKDTRKEIRDNAATCRKAIRKGNKIDNSACVWMGLPLKPPSLKTAAHSSFTKLSALEEELSARPTFTMLGGSRRRRQSKKKKEEKKVKKDAKKAAKKEKKAQKKAKKDQKRVYCPKKSCHKAQIRIAKRNKKEQAREQWDAAKKKWKNYHTSLKQAEFKVKHTPTAVKMLKPIVEKSIGGQSINSTNSTGPGQTVVEAQNTPNYAALAKVNKTLHILRNFMNFKLQSFFRPEYKKLFESVSKAVWAVVDPLVDALDELVCDELAEILFIGGALSTVANAVIKGTFAIIKAGVNWEARTVLCCVIHACAVLLVHVHVHVCACTHAVMMIITAAAAVTILVMGLHACVSVCVCMHARVHLYV